MKNFTLILLLISSTHCFSQVEKLWTQQPATDIRWQQITSLGHYIVGTSEGIMAMNPDNGQVTWRTPEYGPIASEQVQQLGSSPLIAVNLDNAVHLIDPFSGETKFNSQKAGVAEIRDQVVLYNANGILISGKTNDNKDILLMSSMANGEVVWKIEDDYGRMVTASELSPDELLIVTIYYNYKLNPKNGEIIWKNDVSEANAQLEKLGALGGLMKQAATNVAQDIDFNVEFYMHPTKPVFYVASEQEGQAQTSGFSSSTSTGGPSYHTTYSAFNINDGNRIWKEPLDISGKMGPLYFHEKGLVILPDDNLNTKVNLYDYETQEGLWGKKGRGIKVKGGIYSYTKVGDGLILVSQNSSGKNFISYLDLSQGILTFDKPTKVDGAVVFSEKTSKGLLYATTEEVNLLNQSDGSLTLDKSISTHPAMVANKDNLWYIYDTKDGVIKSLDKNTGAVKAISQEISFEGKEDPSNLELRDNGLLLTSSQNMALIGFDGNLVFQKYFEAPREPGIIRALRYAQAVRAAYIGAASYMGAAAFQSAGQQVKDDDPVAGALADGIGQAYGQLGDAATDFAKKSFAMANARFKATAEADDYMVILTKQDKNNVLMKVSKNTGDSEGFIDLGKEREPNYVMDGVTGMVFYNSDGNNILAYKF